MVDQQLISLTSVTRRDSGAYLCIASNGVPPAVSRRMMLEVMVAPVVSLEEELVTARVGASSAFQLCAKDNIQVHGGMGFTWEFDCHLYYRRSNYLALELGGPSEWEARLVDALPQTAVA